MGDSWGFFCFFSFFLPKNKLTGMKSLRIKICLSLEIISKPAPAQIGNQYPKPSHTISTAVYTEGRKDPARSLQPASGKARRKKHVHKAQTSECHIKALDWLWNNGDWQIYLKKSQGLIQGGCVSLTRISDRSTQPRFIEF